jgi:hypothetical protein
VGDRLDNDLRPAKAAGMRTAFIRRGPWGYIQERHPDLPDAADWRMTTLAELPPIVAGANGADAGHSGRIPIPCQLVECQFRETAGLVRVFLAYRDCRRAAGMSWNGVHSLRARYRAILSLSVWHGDDGETR